MLRTEEEIFKDLAQLCVTDGYAHVIAYFCFRDNTIGYGNELTAKDFQRSCPSERLIRTEIATLIGLMCKAEISLETPHPDTLQVLIEKTDELLQELHLAMASPMLNAFENKDAIIKDQRNSLTSAMVLREPIFYSGESAYEFQYRDLAFRKYSNDALWIVNKKGFTLPDAKSIIDALIDNQNVRLMQTLESLRQMPLNQWTTLPAYIVASEDLSRRTELPLGVVDRVLSAFSVKAGPACNTQFVSLNTFNQTNAFPLIDLDNNKFLLFQSFSLSEAFYETPFY